MTAARHLENTLTTIKRQPVNGLIDPVRGAQEYMQTRHLRENVEKQEKKYKGLLMDVLAAQGEPDDKGHRYIYFPNGEVEGLEGIKRERRLSQNLDTDKALALIEELGLQDECLETITETVLNEEALLAANFRNKISDEQLKGLYKTTETFAFVPMKEKK